MFFVKVGVMFLIAGEILRIDDFAKVLESVGLYLMTVLVGMAIVSLPSV